MSFVGLSCFVVAARRSGRRWGSSSACDAIEALQISMHPRIKAFQAFLGDAIKGPVGGGIIAATAVEEHPKGDGETSEKQYKFGSPH